MIKEQYRVIEILSEYSIIINYGKDDGAESGGEIRVITKGPEIIDPLTQETLGTLDKIKATLTIETVYNRFSICKKIKISKSNPLINPLSQIQKTSIEVQPLNVKKDEISNKKFPTDTVIIIGDFVEIL